LISRSFKVLLPAFRSFSVDGWLDIISFLRINKNEIDPRRMISLCRVQGFCLLGAKFDVKTLAYVSVYAGKIYRMFF